MWILPKNYQLSFHFVADMVESKEDLTLPGLNIESSLTLKSKHSPLQTWLRRWKQDSYLPHLFTRILKPSHRKSFETKLALLLEAIPANLLAQPDSAKGQKTQDTYGLTSENTSNQLDLFNASLKMSKDTSALDSEKSLATWKKTVTEQRGEYSQRVKLAHRTKEKESIFWPTARTSDAEGGRIETVITEQGFKSIRKKSNQYFGAKLRDAVETVEEMKWPTPTTQDANKATKRIRKNHQNNLTAIVFSQESLPTPTTRDWKGGYKEASLVRADGKSRRFDSLPNAAIGGVGTDIVPGHLNPDWVEWLMGVPTGWTALGSWGTE
jgi:hypothetical protein